jgi:hypothetical protein
MVQSPSQGIAVSLRRAALLNEPRMDTNSHQSNQVKKFVSIRVHSWLKILDSGDAVAAASHHE